ncbi:type IV toxin-antitoxin system AbiEi family antitoxin domain-containing protein [Dactylosporangium sucinum]|uniref:DUF559 domain-containing protein n=1 Tax=Dactylosporangium sucinum TaxID=1424081 RepID=A0A917X4C6_9ACTN|nr:type IV toxin-antitoxin system AbiEi family antitoxin domain-containing protein [Dactylosporangium sucinum]GGM64152.1 hypothetical protein GCM10007977_077060 [Dactylosporangium sucinum]
MNAGQPDRDRLDEHATAQRGLFTRAQAMTCGYSAYRIRTRIRDGDWVTVVRDVFTDRGRDLTPMLRDTAALLSLPGAVLAGPSAARWHGIPVPSDETVVAHPQRIRRRGIQVLHEEPDLADVCTVDGAAATTVPRTVYDCARLMPDAVARAVLATALEESWTTVPELAGRIRAATGRHGTPRLIRLLRLAAHGEEQAALRLVRNLLQQAGIWGWIEQVPIEDRWGLIGLGDVVFPEVKLLLELKRGDLMPEAAREERRTRLAAAGWSVSEITWHDLTTHPDEFVAELRASLDRLGSFRW